MWFAVLGFMTLGMVTLEALGPDIKDFTRDPGAISEIPWWKGGVSLLGTMLWAAAAMAFAIGASVEASDRGYFMAMTVASAGLGLDDTLRIHENAVPEILGVNEKIVFGVYGLALLVLFWRHRHRMLRHHPVPIVMTGVGLAASIALDLLFDRPGQSNLAGSLEDVPKAWAIAALAAFAFLETRGAAERAAGPVIVATDLADPVTGGSADPELQP